MKIIKINNGITLVKIGISNLSLSSSNLLNASKNYENHMNEEINKPKISIVGAGVMVIKSSELIQSDGFNRQLAAMGKLPKIFHGIRKKK